MIEYPVKLPMLKTRELKLLVDGKARSAILYADGKPVEKANEDGKYLLTDDNWNKIVVTSGVDESGIPWLKVNGIEMLNKDNDALQWYEWAWIGLPCLLIFLGGLVGGLIGGLATAGNIAIMRSGRSAAFRYGLSALLSGSAIVLWLMIAIGVQLAFDQKSRSSSVKSDENGNAKAQKVAPKLVTVKLPAKPETVPNVYIDNDSKQPLNCSIDGKESIEVPPCEFIAFSLKTGKHKFSVKDGTNIEAEIPEGMALLVTPNSSAKYMLSTSSYDTVSGTRQGTVSQNEFRGESKSILSHFGLLEDLPKQIEFKEKSGTIQLAKLMKFQPGDFTPDAAFKILKDWERQRLAYYGQTEENLEAGLLKALGEEPRKRERMEMLLSYAQKLETGNLYGTLAALKNYGKDIPDDALLSFLNTAENEIAAKEQKREAAAARKAEWALQIILENDRAALLAQVMPKLSEKNKYAILNLCLGEKVAADMQVAVLSALFKLPPPQNENSLSIMQRLMNAQKLKPTDELLENVPAFIQKIEKQTRREEWNRFWAEKLPQLLENIETLSPKMQATLLEAAKGESHTARNAVSLLARKGNLATLSPLLKELPKQSQVDFIQQLPKKSEKAPVQEPIKAAWILLENTKENTVRYATLSYLSGNLDSPLEFLLKAWELERKIQDIKEAGAFDNQLWSVCSWNKIEEGDTKALSEVIANAASARWVKAAVNKLCGKRDERTEGLKALLLIYPDTASSQNRVWLMEEIAELPHLEYAKRDKPSEFEALKKAFDAGLADKDPAPRAAALKGAFKLADSEYPSDAAISATLKAEKDPVRLSELEVTKDRRTVNILRHSAGELKNRQSSIPKLLAVASKSSDSKLAIEAINATPMLDPNETAFIDSLAAIAATGKEPERRESALRKLSYLDHSKAPAVSAQLLKSLGDSEPEIRRMAFNALASRLGVQGSEDIFEKLKAASEKESIAKLQGEMKRTLESYTPRKQITPVPDTGKKKKDSKL